MAQTSAQLPRKKPSNHPIFSRPVPIIQVCYSNHAGITKVYQMRLRAKYMAGCPIKLISSKILANVLLFGLDDLDLFGWLTWTAKPGLSAHTFSSYPTPPMASSNLFVEQ